MSSRPEGSAATHRVGQRVEITDEDHPWFTHTGHIIEPFNKPGLSWVVELDEGDYPGQRCAVHDSEIRSKPRGI